ncbi:MAG: GGDEF domain-containing protein [Nitrospirae bacterium]|nr:GGDEF domain-containing protein [Nitrospirota bacterium]
MKNSEALNSVLKQLSADVKLFIELSLRETDDSWDEWLSLTTQGVVVKCWEKKNCRNTDCPAFMRTDGRCWLIAGTMCSGKVRGEFALKYKSCTQCEVYQESVFGDPVTEIYEHLLTLVHSFRHTQDKLRSLATRDPLTGLHNRNYFNEIIMNEVARTKRYGNSFSIVMLDIDNFKWVNDNYGHVFGDKLLRDCAAIMSEAVRASDIIVRFGGDEFLVVIPEHDSMMCQEIINRIRDRIDDWNLSYSSADYSLAVSAGCANFLPGKEIMSVLKEADTRMYANKGRG